MPRAVALAQVGLHNTEAELLPRLDKFKEAVARLAGVTTTRVAVLSYSMQVKGNWAWSRMIVTPQVCLHWANSALHDHICCAVWESAGERVSAVSSAALSWHTVRGS